MLYIGNPCGKPGGDVYRAMSEGRLGCMTTPKQGNRIPDGAWWSADNGKFGKGWPGPNEWFAWLGAQVAKYGTERMLFATAPDVVGDAAASLEEALPWLAPMQSLHVPVAFVAQDGCSASDLIPWGSFDLLFVGGSDAFKLGTEGAWAARQAILRGVPVHMGRVNSKKRLKYALDLGCATADGTYLTFGPQVNLPKVIRWHDELGLPNFRGWTHACMD